MRPRNPTEDEYKQMLANMKRVGGGVVGHTPLRGANDGYVPNEAGNTVRNPRMAGNKDMAPVSLRGKSVEALDCAGRGEAYNPEAGRATKLRTKESERSTMAGSNPAPPPQLPRELVIVGQIKSGKNRILITRTGHRYPPKEFKAWRDEAVEDMRKQWKQPAIIFPVSLWCQYWPGDRRTRDVSGMMDAMFHVLVKAGVLHDDGLVWNCSWFRMEMNKKGPKVLITVREWGL